MRVVLDTNILVSMLLWRKHLTPLFHLLNEKRIIACFSPDTIDELNRVLNYSKIREQAEKVGLDTNSLIRELLASALVVQPDTSISLPLLEEDPSDRIFLACALAAYAACIVTGDKALLKLKAFEDIPILTPKQFIDLSSHL